MVANPPAIDATIMVEQVSYLLIYQSPACFTEFDATIMVEQLLAQKGDIFSSLALAACKGWAERNIGTSEHYAGTRCDFAGFHIPGQTGSFDIWYEAGKIVKFQTNMTTTTNPAMLSVSSETITVTSFRDSPDPAIFNSYCKPS